MNLKILEIEYSEISIESGNTITVFALKLGITIAGVIIVGNAICYGIEKVINNLGEESQDI